MTRVLVVHADGAARAALAARLDAAGYATVVVDRPADAAAVIGSGRIDVVMTDGCRSVATADGLPVVVALPSSATGPDARGIDADAFDVLPWPPTEAGFADVVGRAAKHARLHRRHRPDRDSSLPAGPPAGVSQAARAVRKRVVAASGSAAVLIRGEFGTGRRTLARGLHLGTGPRITVDELPSGHDIDGDVVAARGGTLVLCEVGRLSAASQKHVARAVRTGGVRLVATTADDLDQAVDDGRFDGTLLDLLAGEVITLPPLRERLEDVPELARQILRDQARTNGRLARDVEPDALAELRRYPWPGNVWELANLLARADVVQPGPGPIWADVVRPWLRLPLPSGDGVATTVEALAGKPLADIERRVILSTLQRFNGHRVKTAGALGIGVRTLGIKLKRWKEEGQPIDGVARASGNKK